jgi:hypothetical protein
MLLPLHNESLTCNLPTPDKASFVRIKIQVGSFMVRKLQALVEIVSIWCKNAISILDTFYLVFDMIAQDHVCSTNIKVCVCKLHTPLNTFDFVFDSVHKMLLKSILYNLHKVIHFIFLSMCYVCRDIHVLKIKKSHPCHCSEGVMVEPSLHHPLLWI